MLYTMAIYPPMASLKIPMRSVFFQKAPITKDNSGRVAPMAKVDSATYSAHMCTKEDGKTDCLTETEKNRLTTIITRANFTKARRMAKEFRCIRMEVGLKDSLKIMWLKEKDDIHRKPISGAVIGKTATLTVTDNK